MSGRKEGGQTFLNSHKFTGYERDLPTQLENAKARLYARVKGRFLQPDPLGLGAADMTNPQSLNSYNYVQNDPMNATDPSGTNMSSYSAEYSFGDCGGSGGFWCGGGGFGDHVAEYNRDYGGMPQSLVGALSAHKERIAIAQGRGGVSHFAVDANGIGGWGYWEVLSTTVVGADGGRDTSTWVEWQNGIGRK
jgi:RHS repeat-associated protein